MEITDDNFEIFEKERFSSFGIEFDEYAYSYEYNQQLIKQLKNNYPHFSFPFEYKCDRHDKFVYLEYHYFPDLNTINSMTENFIWVVGRNEMFFAFKREDDMIMAKLTFGG